MEVVENPCPPGCVRSADSRNSPHSFKILTRSHTPGCPPFSCKELTDIALKLRERVDLSPQQRYRLIGVGLSNFREPEDTAGQPDLFH